MSTAVATATNKAWEDQDVPKRRGLAGALLRSLIGPHRRAVTWAVVLVLIEEAAALAGPLLVSLGIDWALPALIRHGDYLPLIATATAYVACGVGSGLLKMSFMRLSGRVSQDVMIDLRARIFRHAQRLSLDFHEHYTSGRLISRSTSDLDSLQTLLDMGLDGLVTVVLTVGYTAVLLVFLDWRLGLVTLASFLPLWFATRWFRRYTRTVYRRSRVAVARVIVKYVETMNGIRAVQAFRRERPNESEFKELNEAYAKANSDSMVAFAVYSPAVRLLGNLTVTGILVWGAVRVVHGSLELGTLTAFVLYIRRLYDPLDHLAMFLNAYQSASAALEKIADLLAEEPTVPEPERPLSLPARAEGSAPGRELLFTDVSFSYDAGSRETPVLPRFDLRIPAGQTVAVVGATGAGKSTLAKLLTRFYDPVEGRVLLDGVDLRRLETAELRRGVVMVTQESFLFSGTIADNIAVGRPGATREEVVAAAAAIGAHEFVEALPEGYDTDVRKRGGRISAGQRQLVSFARALLADPAVLVLDEATSSLDIPGERAVQSAMRTVLAGRTAVIIAHRLSTVEIADRVLVMADGRIIEDGTPAELISDSGGRFARLHRAWRESLVA
jgi:ATP-binding cassette subfamily B protein